MILLIAGFRKLLSRISIFPDLETTGDSVPFRVYKTLI